MTSKTLSEMKVDLLKARKSKDQRTSSILQTFIGDAEPGGNVTLSESQVQDLIQKYLKTAYGNLKIYAPQGISVRGIKEEIDILEKYAPKKLSEDELVEIVNEFVKAGSTNMGQVMGKLKSGYPNQYDGATASKIVKDILK